MLAGVDRCKLEHLPMTINGDPYRIAFRRLIVSGHDFSRAVTAAKSTRPLQAAEKLTVLKGHDFSRAVSRLESMRALELIRK
jgi:hypothetical protein